VGVSRFFGRWKELQKIKNPVKNHSSHKKGEEIKGKGWVVAWPGLKNHKLKKKP